MGFIINFINNEWEVRFANGKHKPMWFDGDISVEVVLQRATEIWKAIRDSE